MTRFATLIPLVASAVLCVRGPSFGAVVCTGDINFDRVVTVDELIGAVNAALGTVPVAVGSDADGDGHVTIAELTAAVGYALTTCPAARAARTDCPVPPPPGQDPERVRCGRLVVPERRDHLDGHAVEIAYMVVPSVAADPAPDPVIYVDGGPAYRTLEGTLPLHTPAVIGPLLAHRDLVYFDARGVGQSRPALDCPEIDAAMRDRLTRNQNAATDTADRLGAVTACRARLVADGVDLAAYTSAESARDIADLAAALGYTSYNIVGTSYGSRVALTVLRDAPADVRSVVLELPIPPQAFPVADSARNAERVLDLVGDICAADPSCGDDYPDLPSAVFAIAATLDATPLSFTLADGQPFVLNGDRFVEMVVAFLTSPAQTTALPAFLTQTTQGSGWLLPIATEGFAASSPFSWGTQASVACPELTPLTPELIDAANAGVRERLVQVIHDSSVHYAVAACAIWDVPAAPPEDRAPVHSDVPALVMAGALDPITPPAYGATIVSTLSRGQLIEMPNTGHWNFDGGGCGVTLAAAFFDDPTAPLDTSCLAAIPPLGFL